MKHTLHSLQHNKDILAKLALEDGSVLRAMTNALPTLDCLMRDPQADGGGLLQIWAVNKLPGEAPLLSYVIWKLPALRVLMEYHACHIVKSRVMTNLAVNFPLGHRW